MGLAGCVPLQERGRGPSDDSLFVGLHHQDAHGALCVRDDPLWLSGFVSCGIEAYAQALQTGADAGTDARTPLTDAAGEGQRIQAISAPSRASTLAHYAGLDDGLIDCILEIDGSRKIGRTLPGTLIPVVEESRLFADQPEYALMFSWHIADELAPKLRDKGYKGKFIVPLPRPRII